MGNLKRTDNIYGDICSVKKENIFKAISECGSHKILFGTDAIVKGIDTYNNYLPIIRDLSKNLNKTDAENILFRNCKRLYNLTV